MRQTDLPVGQFVGTVQGPRWFQAFVGAFWSGKVFRDDVVTNLIRGRERISGQVHREGAVVFVDYPQLGLRDTLTRRGDDGLIWDGALQFGLFVFHFTLTKE